MSEDCDFCAQIDGNRVGNSLFRLLGGAWAKHPVLLEYDFSVAMPSIGALSAGHLLVCPKGHARSLVAANEEVAQDVLLLAAHCRERLEAELSLPVHTFEHGSSTLGGRIACSVEHAHLHLLPAAVEIRTNLTELCDWEPVEQGLDSVRQQAAGREYLFYEAPDGERIMGTTETGFSSQLLRIVFAEAMGRSGMWNWREHPATPAIEETISLFAPARVAAISA